MKQKNSLLKPLVYLELAGEWRQESMCIIDPVICQASLTSVENRRTDDDKGEFTKRDT